MELSKVNTMRLNGFLQREWMCQVMRASVFHLLPKTPTSVSIAFRLASLCQGLLQRTEKLSLYNTNIMITCTINTHPDNPLHLRDMWYCGEKKKKKNEIMGREGGKKEKGIRAPWSRTQKLSQLFLSSLGPWAILFPYLNLNSIICKWRKHLEAFSKDEMIRCGKCFVYYVSL